MKRIIFILAIVGMALSSQGKIIHNNNGANIVSSGTGSYRVVSCGDFTLKSENAANSTFLDNFKIDEGASVQSTSATCLTVTGILTNGAGIAGLKIPTSPHQTIITSLHQLIIFFS